MIPPIPKLEDYSISTKTGFLPQEPPLARLPDPYYAPWENVLSNLQALLMTKRIRAVADKLPILSLDGLNSEAEQRRAYAVLGYLAHGYVWGGDKPCEVLPASISVPYLAVSSQLQMPPVATYAAVALWNFRPIFPEPLASTNLPDYSLDNLTTLYTFTGSLDESWFCLISVAIEAYAGPVLQLLIDAIHGVREDNPEVIVEGLRCLAETLDGMTTMLGRMGEMCDPHIFYSRIRPYLAGSKDMEEAGLPHGVYYPYGKQPEDGGEWKRLSGGSNAQSSLIQFFDTVLGVQHRPTGEKPSMAPTPGESSGPSAPPPPKHNFLLGMRQYMPFEHRRFLEDLSAAVSPGPYSLRSYVENHKDNKALAWAYDASLAMLRVFRDRHIQIVGRYIIIPAKEAGRRRRDSVLQSASIPTLPATIEERQHDRDRAETGFEAPPASAGILAGYATTIRNMRSRPQNHPPTEPVAPLYTQLSVPQSSFHSLLPGTNVSQPNSTGTLRGTGGTALIPFLKQARDETGEPAIDAWAKRLLREGSHYYHHNFRAMGPAATLQSTSVAVASSDEDSSDASTYSAKSQISRVAAHTRSRADSQERLVGLAGQWLDSDDVGGLCHW